MCRAWEGEGDKGLEALNLLSTCLSGKNLSLDDRSTACVMLEKILNLLVPRFRMYMKHVLLKT